MRVVCSSIDDFLENLKDVSSIFDSTIRMNLFRQPVLSPGQKETSKFEVIVQVSTVVIVETGEYLLDVGERCGFDYEDADAERNGSIKASEVKRSIEEFANERGWRVRPGVIFE